MMLGRSKLDGSCLLYFVSIASTASYHLAPISWNFSTSIRITVVDALVSCPLFLMILSFRPNFSDKWCDLFTLP